MALDIREIKERYYTGQYSADKLYEFKDLFNLRKVSVGFIFDENLSVKRNREMVEEHNKKVEENRAIAKEKQDELDKQLAQDVIDYIVDNYNINRKQAEIVNMFVYEEYHSCMVDYFNMVDVIVELAEKLVSEAHTNE